MGERKADSNGSCGISAEKVFGEESCAFFVVDSKPFFSA